MEINCKVTNEYHTKKPSVSGDLPHGMVVIRAQIFTGATSGKSYSGFFYRVKTNKGKIGNQCMVKKRE